MRKCPLCMRGLPPSDLSAGKFRARFSTLIAVIFFVAFWAAFALIKLTEV